MNRKSYEGHGYTCSAGMILADIVYDGVSTGWCGEEAGSLGDMQKILAAYNIVYTCDFDGEWRHKAEAKSIPEADLPVKIRWSSAYAYTSLPLQRQELAKHLFEQSLTSEHLKDVSKLMAEILVSMSQDVVDEEVPDGLPV